jgi:hypothetical protein
MPELPQYQRSATPEPIGVVRVDRMSQASQGMFALSQAGRELANDAMAGPILDAVQKGREQGALGGAARDADGKLTYQGLDDTSTPYRQAYAVSALAAYKSGLEQDARSKAKDLQSQFETGPKGIDPEGFLKAWDPVAQGAVDGTPQRFAGYAKQIYTTQGQDHYLALLGAAREKRYQQDGLDLKAHMAELAGEGNARAANGEVPQPGDTADASFETLSPIARVERQFHEAAYSALQGGHLTPEQYNQEVRKFQLGIRRGAYENEVRQAWQGLGPDSDLSGAYKRAADVTKRIDEDPLLSDAEKETMRTHVERLSADYGTGLVHRRTEQDFQLQRYYGALVAALHLQDVNDQSEGDSEKIRRRAQWAEEVANRAGVHGTKMMDFAAQAATLANSMDERASKTVDDLATDYQTKMATDVDQLKAERAARGDAPYVPPSEVDIAAATRALDPDRQTAVREMVRHEIPLPHAVAIVKSDWAALGQGDLNAASIAALAKGRDSIAAKLVTIGTGVKNLETGIDALKHGKVLGDDEPLKAVWDAKKTVDGLRDGSVKPLDVDPDVRRAAAFVGPTNEMALIEAAAKTGRMFPQVKDQLGSFANSDDPAALERGLNYWRAAVQGNAVMGAKLPGSDFWAALDTEWDRRPATPGEKAISIVDAARRIREGMAAAAGLPEPVKQAHQQQAQELVSGSLPDELKRQYGPGLLQRVLPSFAMQDPLHHEPGQGISDPIMTETIGATQGRQYAAALERVVRQQLDAGREPGAALRIGIQQLSGQFQPSYLSSADPQRPVMAFNPPELAGINDRRAMDEVLLKKLPMGVEGGNDPSAWLPTADRAAFEDAVRRQQVAYVSTPARDGWYAFAADRSGKITALPDASGNPMVIRPDDVGATPSLQRREAIAKEWGEAARNWPVPPAMRGAGASVGAYFQQKLEGVEGHQGPLSGARPAEGFETSGPFGRLMMRYGVDPVERSFRDLAGPPRAPAEAGRLRSLGTESQPGLKAAP